MFPLGHVRRHRKIPQIIFLEARRAQKVLAMHNGLRPQVAILEFAAGPEVHVEMRAMDVVGCFGVAHYERL